MVDSGGMRAWILESVGQPLQAAEVAEPSLRGGGVVIEVVAAHIPAYTGVLLTGVRGAVPTPLVLGSGGIGRVLAVADDVFNVAPGDVVANLSLLGSGDPTDPQEVIVGWTGVGGTGTRTATTTRMQDVWRDGVFAERALCPKENLLRLPGAQSYEHLEKLAFLPWLAIAGEGWVRGEQGPGQVVAVLGATGQLGAAAVLVALARGASRVVAVGRNTDALDRLAALDPRVVPVPLTGDRSHDAAAIARAGDAGAITRSGRGGVDVVLDALGAAPSPDPTLAGYDALRPGGTLVLVGGVREDLAVPYGDLMRRRLTLRGSWMARPATVLALWRMIAAGTLDLAALEMRTVGLDDPAGALDLAAATTGLGSVALVPGAARH